VANPNPLEGAQEIQKMLVSYAKQETVEPLKTLGRFLAFGVAGALFVFLGSFFLGLGVLRLLQSETGSTFGGGNWASTVPYLIALAALLAIMGFIFMLFMRAKKRVMT
jgi:hypothetical protein